MLKIKPKSFKLKNNIDVISFLMPFTETVTVLTLVKIGSRYEEERLQGISHFLEHLFFKGTKKRPTTIEIAHELDNMGAEFNAFTSKEYTGFYITAASKYIDIILDILSDILLNSLFKEEEIQKERGAVIEEMNMFQDTPMRYIGDVFEELLYGDTPLGRKVIGAKKTLNNMKRDDFINYFKENYNSQNIVISIAGKFENLNLEKFLGNIKRGKKSEYEKYTDNQKIPQVFIMDKKTDQAQVAIGYKTFSVFDKRRTILDVLATILGGGMSSRLFTEVRERRGLCYFVRTFAEHYLDQGYIGTFSGVTLNKIDKAIKIILQEHKKIIKYEISPKELNKAKEYIKGKFLLSAEGSYDIAHFIGMEKLILDRVISIEDYFKEIQGVTTIAIKKIAQEIFIPEQLNLAIIGPFKNEENRFQKLIQQ